MTIGKKNPRSAQCKICKIASLYYRYVCTRTHTYTHVICKTAFYLKIHCAMKNCECWMCCIALILHIVMILGFFARVSNVANKKKPTEIVAYRTSNSVYRAAAAECMSCHLGFAVNSLHYSWPQNLTVIYRTSTTPRALTHYLHVW